MNITPPDCHVTSEPDERRLYSPIFEVSFTQIVHCRHFLFVLPIGWQSTMPVLIEHVAVIIPSLARVVRHISGGHITSDLFSQQDINTPAGWFSPPHHPTPYIIPHHTWGTHTACEKKTAPRTGLFFPKEELPWVR